MRLDSMARRIPGRREVRAAAVAALARPSRCVAAITLALGIGANSAIFALVDATLLRPLPFRDPDRLVMIWERTDASPTRRGVAARISPTGTSAIGRSIGSPGSCPGVGGMVMAGADGSAETVPRQWVTAGIFDALGVKAIVGRTFLPSDDSRRANVVVLSEAFWRARFNADPTVVGRDIRLDGAPYTVVGVVPKESQLIGRSSIWAMVSIQGAPPEAADAYVLRAIGRLAVASRSKPPMPIWRPSPTAGARVPEDEQGARRHPRTDARRGDRQRSSRRPRCCSLASSASSC